VSAKRVAFGIVQFSIAESRHRLRMGIHKLLIEFFDLLAMLPRRGIHGFMRDCSAAGLDMISIHDDPIVARNPCGRRRSGIFWPGVCGQTEEEHHIRSESRCSQVAEQPDTGSWGGSLQTARASA
jgi:hypothetical protein